MNGRVKSGKARRGKLTGVAPEASSPPKQAADHQDERQDLPLRARAPGRPKEAREREGRRSNEEFRLGELALVHPRAPPRLVGRRGPSHL